jgi:prefoldin subunit 5
MKPKQKLLELRAEFERGQHLMEELDQRRADLRETMLRISGAIQVLEELLNEEDHQRTGPNGETAAAPAIPAEDRTA